jgi:hypothetical protein
MGMFLKIGLFLAKVAIWFAGHPEVLDLVKSLDPAAKPAEPAEK